MNFSEKDLRSKMKLVLHYAREADYCDVRVVGLQQNHISYYNQNLESEENRYDRGLSVRVMIGGSWGFSCTPDFSQESLRQVTHEAIQLAKAGVKSNRHPHQLSPRKVAQDSWHYPQILSVTPQNLQEVQELLRDCNGCMQSVSPSIKVAQSLFRHKKTHWWFMDNEGSDLTQSWMRTGVGVQATAVHANNVQKRSYNMRNALAGGYEHVVPARLMAASQLMAKEAIELTLAAEVEAKKTDLIIGTNQLALQIHESVGHPNELDRVLGWEANFAGTSFNQISNRKTLRYGSPLVNFVADGQLPTGTGSRAYDDDGVPAQRWYIVKEGVFQDYYTSRDTAHYLGPEETSRGCNRADSWSSVPIIRIPNVSLLPGNCKLEELINDMEDGIYLDINRSWSIDQRRDQFQFGVEMAYEIKKGKRTRLLKNVVYRGRTIPFWNSCDAICDNDEFQVFGEIHCGKGQPTQTMEMAHGCSPARFRQVDVRPS